MCSIYKVIWHRGEDKKPQEESSQATKPLELKLSVLAMVSILAGGGIAFAAGFEEGSMAAGLISLFVVVAAIAAPQPATFRAGIASGVVAGLALMLTHLTGSTPVLAGVSMAVVALLTGVAVAGGPIVGAIGSVIGTAYFIPAALSLTEEFSSGRTAELGLIGLFGGLLVVLAVVISQRIRGVKQPERKEKSRPDGPGPLARIAKALRDPSPERNYGLRRALLLGTGLALYLATDNHNLLWILLTIFIVLKPDMESTWTKAIARSKGTIVGALAVGTLAQFLSGEVVAGIGLVALVVTIAYYRRNYAVYAAGVSFLVVALMGEQQGDFISWAALRAADAVIGSAIAVAAVYFILPEKEGAARPT
jgi:MFS family permease